MIDSMVQSVGQIDSDSKIIAKWKKENVREDSQEDDAQEFLKLFLNYAEAIEIVYFVKYVANGIAQYAINFIFLIKRLEFLKFVQF